MEEVTWERLKVVRFISRPEEEKSHTASAAEISPSELVYSNQFFFFITIFYILFKYIIKLKNNKIKIKKRKLK